MNLLSVQGQGLVYTVVIFLICVIVVHFFVLSRIGYRTLHKKLPPEQPKEEPPRSEPVYYIVEKKKKKRAKSEYANPREIKFK